MLFLFFVVWWCEDCDDDVLCTYITLGPIPILRKHIFRLFWHPPSPPQCVELKLRWQFYVHGSTCPKIYLWSKFWIIFDISINSRNWLGFAQKHIWNIFEEIVFKKSENWQFLNTISSIMFRICFWANRSRDLMFEISKITQKFY